MEQDSYVRAAILDKKNIWNQISLNARKTILEDYFNEGLIMSTFSIEGVKAERRRKPEKWSYSDELEQYKKDMTDAIESKEQHEREEGIAKKKETSYTWAIR